MEHVVTVLEILRQHPSASRAELADLTGLSLATISRVVARLKREGLVEERTAEAAGIGRPPQVVELRANALHVLGIDAGGTRVRAVLTDLEGTVRGSAMGIVRSPRDGEAVIATIARVAEEARAAERRGRVLAAGVGVSGIVDGAAGRVPFSPDLPGLQRIPVAHRLERTLRVPVGIEGDDLAAAVGEAALGAARGCSDVVFLSLGYGLGAGLIVGGRPVRGTRGAAGAIAYLVPGKLEDRASGRVIPVRYRERARGAGRPMGRLDAKRVFHLAAEGDRAAVAVVTDVVDALGQLVVNVAALLDPEVIVVGGGLTASGATLLDPLADRLAASVPFPPRLVPSELGDEAVARGAAVLALALGKRGLAEGLRSPSVRAEPARIGALQLV
jgi:predicted NBD/HSP70 family sugar kinase